MPPFLPRFYYRACPNACPACRPVATEPRTPTVRDGGLGRSNGLVHAYTRRPARGGGGRRAVSFGRRSAPLAPSDSSRARGRGKPERA
eukprot:659468-Prymnesium_polylepis.1